METIKNYFFNKEVELEDLGGGVKRKIMAYQGSLMLCELQFEEGSVGALHKHYHEQMTYIASGTFEFTIGDEKKIVTAGDVLYKQPNIVHGAVCLKKGKLIDIFTPQREDFLEKINTPKK